MTKYEPTPGPEVTLDIGRLGETDIIAAQFPTIERPDWKPGFGITVEALARTMVANAGKESVLWFPEAENPADTDEVMKRIGGRLWIYHGTAGIPERVEVDREPVRFSLNQLIVLNSLAKKAGRIVPTSELADLLWPDKEPTPATHNNVQVHVSKVKTNLGVLGEAIHTERRIGYVMLDNLPKPKSNE